LVWSQCLTHTSMYPKSFAYIPFWPYYIVDTIQNHCMDRERSSLHQYICILHEHVGLWMKQPKEQWWISTMLDACLFVGTGDTFSVSDNQIEVVE
jgi:hypothetical protein